MLRGRLLAFHDPLHPEFTDELHEWFFRSGLDHLVWVVGMLSAFSFPWCDRQLQAIETLPAGRRAVTRVVVGGVALVVGGWWFVEIFMRPKLLYNKVHPFTSWIPIMCYCVLRNLTPTLRRWHMHLFAWTGKITLETYILQAADPRHPPARAPRAACSAPPRLPSALRAAAHASPAARCRSSTSG